jgi:hypothetical protein
MLKKDDHHDDEKITHGESEAKCVFICSPAIRSVCENEKYLQRNKIEGETINNRNGWNDNVNK